MAIRSIPTALMVAGMVAAAQMPALAHQHDGMKAPEKKADCCEDMGKGKADACCEDMGKDKDKAGACCEEDMGGKGEACEDMDHAPGHGDMKGMHHDMQGEACECGEGMGEHHGMMGDHHGMMGHPGMMAWHMRGMKTAELRFMPPTGMSGNQYVVLAMGPSMRVNDWFTMGFQHNLAVQLNPQTAGNWVNPYCGVLPKVGFDLGPTRVDLGALVGLGAMLRTTSGTEYLQARVNWAVEPRLEIGVKGDRMGGGLVATYLMTPNMNDFGGVSVGLRLTAKGGRW